MSASQLVAGRRQTTRHILMVRPANFAFNPETATNNTFQNQDGKYSTDELRERALAEFDGLVDRLRNAGVHVIVGKDSNVPVKPDAVFPNNWVTFHQEDFVITYPMFAPTRRPERRRKIIDTVLNEGFHSDHRINFEFNEKRNRFLEGTGSVVFDHQNRLIYACLSPRTDAELLKDLSEALNYENIVFHAVDADGREIYHTNVMMAMGETFVVVCLDTVRDAQERAMLEAQFKRTGKEIVEIGIVQMNAFAGNMLQVRNHREETLLVMSEQAYRALTPAQIKVLSDHTKLLYSPLHTIETYGGGSARCMMAEVFLPEEK
jgi:hypothetical protein